MKFCQSVRWRGAEGRALTLVCGGERTSLDVLVSSCFFALSCFGRFGRLFAFWARICFFLAPSFSLVEIQKFKTFQSDWFAKFSSRDYYFEQTFRVPILSRLVVWLVLWPPRPWSLDFHIFHPRHGNVFGWRHRLALWPGLALIFHTTRLPLELAHTTSTIHL